MPWLYLRWSNDWFITSQIVEATPGGDGLTYTATIPSQPDGNSCFYTVLTSTTDLTGYTWSGIIDDLTLAVNGTFNALPTPPPSPHSDSNPHCNRYTYCHRYSHCDSHTYCYTDGNSYPYADRYSFTYSHRSPDTTSAEGLERN